MSAGEMDSALLKQKINELDLSATVNRLVVIGCWPVKKALQACKQYRCFLFLRFKYSNNYPYPLPPSIGIDEFWHHHILHTQKYSQDCQCLFGDYMHHHPHHGYGSTISEEELQKRFERTKELYLKEFGHALERTWPGRIRLAFQLLKMRLLRQGIGVSRSYDMRFTYI